MSSQQTALDLGSLPDSADQLPDARRIHFVRSLSDVPKDRRGHRCMCWWDRVTEHRGLSAGRVLVGFEITRIHISCKIHGDSAAFYRAWEERLLASQCHGRELVKVTDDQRQCPECGSTVDAIWLLYGDDPKQGFQPVPWPIRGPVTQFSGPPCFPVSPPGPRPAPTANRQPCPVGPASPSPQEALW